MFMTSAVRRLFAVGLAFFVCGSAEAEFTYTVSGALGAPWGWNFPADTLPTGTAFTATVTFKLDVAGTPDPYSSSYTDYVGAATELSFLINDRTYRAFGGTVITGVAPNGADYFGFQWFTSYSGDLDDLPLRDAGLALRDSSGLANPSGLIMSDLRGFLPSLNESTAILEFRNGVATAQFVGGVSTLAAVPEPRSLMLTISAGVLILGRLLHGGGTRSRRISGASPTD